jgi:pimeloyl-ACP methyl ester carboxylesterase
MNSRLMHLQGCGHLMTSEQPNQVLDAMSAFVLT